MERKKYYENYRKALFVYIFTSDSINLSEHSSSLWFLQFQPVTYPRETNFQRKEKFNNGDVIK